MFSIISLERDTEHNSQMMLIYFLKIAYSVIQSLDSSAFLLIAEKATIDFALLLYNQLVRNNLIQHFMK